MSACWKTPRRLASVLAVAALAALSLGATAHLEAPAHHQAALVTYVAPAPLDEMEVAAVTRLTVQRAVLAQAEARARAEARRKRDAVLLAYREHVLAVQAARARVAAAVQVAAPVAVPAVSGAQVFSYGGIEGLWLAAGGPAAAESTAACIAEHESQGRSWATHVDNPSQTDYGLFQIGFDPAALDPQVAALTAVRMSHDGTDWSRWTTHSYCEA